MTVQDKPSPLASMALLALLATPLAASAQVSTEVRLCLQDYALLSRSGDKAAALDKLRDCAKQHPGEYALQKTLGKTRIWSLRRADSTNPIDGLSRSVALDGCKMKAEHVKYMVENDPRTKRRLRALGILGQLRDLYAKGSKGPSQLAGNQRLLALLPLIEAHIAVERKRGYVVEWQPVTSDVELPGIVTDAILWMQKNKLEAGELRAMRDRKLRHMYSAGTQKLVQRQVEAAFQHYRYEFTAIVAEIEPALEKLAKREETDRSRVKYEALRTTLIALRSMLR